MVKGKRNSFSKEEKQIIQNMKNQLSMMKVPREEWSSIIQEELTQHRKMKSKSSKGRITKIFEKIWQKILKIFFKLTSKEYRENADEFDQIFNMLEKVQEEGGFAESNEMMRLLNPEPNTDRENLDKLGNKHGTFVKDRPDKKKKIIEFDDDLE
ncbi:MAG: hypothetical protein P8Y70_02330 [Candidatus Lokiarchaeota archaeon]